MPYADSASSLLKKAIHGFFNNAIRKCDFRIAYIVNDFQSSKMAVHPCTT